MKYLIFMILIVPSLCFASTEKPVKFDKYFEGALEVYSQFETPSKKESEEFYVFVKAKWNKSTCTIDCDQWGYAAGQEYAKKKNIKIEKK
ncbi:rI lysis inhibition regulator [Acinetobacter phage Ac42]|uniref:lysis inhibition n=1 Tax=Acinetobacter phage Ac42 TaxID=762660 RepID=UPI0001EBCD61|nr:lysis inhibition [Acinetobacter phage Ac42]ADI96376.1 rI lysis inhibition regulator [Acinetobacter phage Ac42]